MKIFAVFFSGTGNTKYAVEQLLRNFDGSEMHSIEEPLDFIKAASEFDTVLVAHPIYGSDMPINMLEFIKSNLPMFDGKKLITLVTQFLFSGDGGRLAFRLVRNRIKEHTVSIHISMPTNVNFQPIFSVKNGSDILPKIEKASRKIALCAERMHMGRPIRDGRGPLSFVAGFLGQRLWYKMFFIKHYRKMLLINSEKCIRCDLCVKSCPVENLVLVDETIETRNKCVLCYRCVNQCPVHAITLISKNDARVQYKGPMST